MLNALIPEIKHSFIHHQIRMSCANKLHFPLSWQKLPEVSDMIDDVRGLQQQPTVLTFHCKS